MNRMSDTSKSVLVRFSRDQYERLCEVAESLGMGVSVFARAATLRAIRAEEVQGAAVNVQEMLRDVLSMGPGADIRGEQS